MSEIDFAMAYKFADPAIPKLKFQLRFRTEDVELGSPSLSNPAGQLIATVVDYGHPDHGLEIPVSRPDVLFNDVEAAVDRDHLPFLEPNRVNLAQIRRRIHNAGLD
jgi:hypothetical protein